MKTQMSPGSVPWEQVPLLEGRYRGERTVNQHSPPRPPVLTSLPVHSQDESLLHLQ